MKMGVKALLLSMLLTFSTHCLALSEPEAEDMADLTAVFVFLKNDCDYHHLPDDQIRRALVYYAEKNQWDLSDYNRWNMRALTENSYNDLRGIAIPTATKCKSLARNTLSLVTWVE